MRNYRVEVKGSSIPEGHVKAKTIQDAIAKYRDDLISQGVDVEGLEYVINAELNPNALKEAKKRYDANMKKVLIRFDHRSEQDLIDKLESVGSVAVYVKSLIRKDIGK